MSHELIVVIGLIAVAFGLAAWALFRPPKKLKQPGMILHEMPPLRGDGKTPCCGIHPRFLPPQDQLTWHANEVTCRMTY